jgi:hypothetical protein
LIQRVAGEGDRHSHDVRFVKGAIDATSQQGPDPGMAFCPYCGREKETFTDEHVVPRALGGNVEPANPFKLRVCDTCNAASGRRVDGRFVRSFLVHNARAQAANDFYDPRVEPVIPLFYFGPQHDWPDTSTVCDFWLGPTGDSIFHVHRPYSEEPSDRAWVGKPPHLKSSAVDRGVVYVGVVGTNPEWHPIIDRSVREAFLPGTPIHYLNAAPEGQQPPFPAVAAERQAQLDWIRSCGQLRRGRFVIDLVAGDRFLAKLALGIGTITLGDDFCRSQQASVLRSALWERDPKKRRKLKFKGKDFSAETSTLGRSLLAVVATRCCSCR